MLAYLEKMKDILFILVVTAAYSVRTYGRQQRRFSSRFDRCSCLGRYYGYRYCHQLAAGL